jgi:branched-subunit amino acid transport protein
MALSYTARKRWSLVILLMGLPAYVIVAVNLVGLFDRPPFWVELLIYIGLGIIWALPFRFVFKGIGQVDPDAQKAEGHDPSA